MSTPFDPTVYTAMDRPGIFKAKVLEAFIQDSADKSEPSKSVAVVFKFEILAALEANEWKDWSGFGPYAVTGYYYVLGKDGKPNQKTIEQLVKSLGWDGNLQSFVEENSKAIGRTVQITVEENNYNGKTTYRAGWMNHEDFAPGPKGVDADRLKSIQSESGSLLRAAAAAAAKPANAPAPPKPKEAPKPAATKSKGKAAKGDDTPF
jgi:hypothetical protein